MPTNEFYTYATEGSSLNVQSLLAYAGSSIRDDGAVSGLASAPTANRVWRQGANMASAIGELIIARTDLDALDDGNIATLKTAIETAILAVARTITPPGYNFAKFAANGTFLVPAGITRVRARVWGGGGGGGGAQGGGGAGGGGGGGYAESWITVTPGSTLEVDIGGGGTAGSNVGGSAGANSGGGGGFSRVRLSGGPATVYAYAEGGQGGQGTFGGGAGDHGPAGAGTTGDLLFVGGDGLAGYSGTPSYGGAGGSSAMGGGGGSVSTGLPSAAGNYGGGGGGGSSTFAGGAGAQGFAVIEY